MVITGDTLFRFIWIIWCDI